jgi:hypothetical protein
MAVDTSKFAVQAVFEIKTFDLETGSCLALLDDLKETTWENNGEVVYAQGGRGNPKVIGFGHSKTSMLNTQNATIVEGALAMQTGSDTIELTNSTSVTYTDIQTVADDAVTTQFTATGTTGAEIGFVYVLNSDGTLGTPLTQAATVAAGKFTYTTGTKKVTFNTAELADGVKVIMFYKPTLASGKRIVNKTDIFAKNVKVIADGLFRDTCTGKDYAGQLVYDKAKVQEGYTFTLTANGEPSVHNLNFEALKACGANELWNLYIYDETDFS